MRRVDGQYPMSRDEDADLDSLAEKHIGSLVKAAAKEGLSVKGHWKGFLVGNVRVAYVARHTVKKMSVAVDNQGVIYSASQPWIVFELPRGHHLTVMRRRINLRKFQLDKAMDKILELQKEDARLSKTWAS